MTTVPVTATTTTGMSTSTGPIPAALPTLEPLMYWLRTAISMSTSTTTSPPNTRDIDILYNLLTEPELVYNASISDELNNTDLVNYTDLVNPVSTDKLANNEAADIVIGSLTVFLAIVGLFGNVSSFLYFWPRRNKTIHPFLYAIICVVDVCTSVASVPVIVSLFSARSPVMFTTLGVCTSWSVVFHFLLKMSMFLVMPVSITRTIAVTIPFYKTNKCAVINGIVWYAVLLLTVDVVYLSAGWLKTDFREQETMCEFSKEVALHDSHSHSHSAHIYSILLTVELLFPALITTASFVVVVVALVRGGKKRGDEKRFQRASVTVAIFTAVFLLCNLPCFLVKTVHFVSHFERGYEVLKPIRKNAFFRWYGHLLADFFLTLLNAALNPCLYFLRMPQYRRWSSEMITTANLQQHLPLLEMSVHRNKRKGNARTV